MLGLGGVELKEIIWGSMWRCGLGFGCFGGWCLQAMLIGKTSRWPRCTVTA